MPKPEKYRDRRDAQRAADQATSRPGLPTVHQVRETRDWAGRTRFTVSDTGQVANPVQRRNARRNSW